ncbi:hypothetical protein B1209_12575 [Raoultella planticola]|uniref:hypothetical protein n=1 Tax=Raoultella ornithinolytica TaxID=54291 RepID=UPI000CD33F91|nr:hypothetical protein B1209_12575 [Raoultella planticola]
MTTDITELAQREKFEAWFVNDVVGADVNFPAFKDGEYAEGEIYDEQLYFMLQAMWMAWKAANAELVEALEKAQQRISELESPTFTFEVTAEPFTCPRCGTTTTHPEGWHYCHKREAE